MFIQGFDRERKVYAFNDTAELRAFLFNEEDQPILADYLTAVDFTIQRPDGTKITLQGEIDADGSGFVAYDATDTIGHYTTVATFTTDENVRRSMRSDFEVIDPFNPPLPTTDDLLNEAVWHRFEDLFDGEEEGPWLRDMTLNHFGKKKMSEFAADAVFELNNMNPPTMANLDLFIHDGTLTPDGPLLVQGTFLVVLRHLIRSYTEQPAPTGAAVGYLDRRDYMQRWQAVYQLELAVWQRWSALWKRQFLGLGHGRLLVANKASRTYGPYQRTRAAGRGYY